MFRRSICRFKPKFPLRHFSVEHKISDLEYKVASLEADAMDSKKYYSLVQTMNTQWKFETGTQLDRFENRQRWINMFLGGSLLVTAGLALRKQKN
jgi:hypothetical protein